MSAAPLSLALLLGVFGLRCSEMPRGRSDYGTGSITSGLLAKVPQWSRQEGFAGNARALTGASLFVRSGCMNCHTYLGSGSPNLGAPDLSAEGRRNRGIAFQIRHLRCPSCTTPDSAMPPFKALGSANLRRLATFLEASKGPK